MPKIKSVKKSLGNQTVLQNFSLDFPSTGCVVLMGRSGCGKTTLLRILAGLDAPDEGILEGFDRGKVAMAFQEYRLFQTIDALENAKLASPLAKEDAREAAVRMLTRLGFTEADMKKKPSELSGGMRQRISVARAFLSERPVILLDEPTKELDLQFREALTELFREQSETKLLIIVTHLEEDAKMLGVTPIRLSDS